MINFPNIIEDACPKDAVKACQADTGDSPELILKPEIVTVCAPGVLQFSTVLRNSQGEQEITNGLSYSSSNPACVSVDPQDGRATVLGAGIVTISVTFSGMSATGQVSVVGTGSNCCDSITVRTVTLEDNSKSMSQQFSPELGHKGAVARTLVTAWINALNPKDQMALASFGSGQTLWQDFTSTTADLINALGFPTETAEQTDIADAITFAIGRLTVWDANSRNVIFLASDGYNAPPLSEAAATALISATDSFKSRGGIIVVAGIRAAGSAFSLLSRIASAGFFINYNNSADVAQKTSSLTTLPSFYCGGTCENQPLYYVYCTQGETEGAQVPDPAPLPDIENGESTGDFTSTQTECVQCTEGEAIGTVNLVPKMTSNVLPIGQAFSTPSSSESYKAFDGDETTAIYFVNSVSGKVGYKFTGTQLVTGYSVGIPGTTYFAAPSAWTFEGSNDGVTYTVLDTRIAVSFAAGEKKSFQIANTVMYRYYRLNVTGNQTGVPTTNVVIGTLEMTGAAPDQICATATATSSVSQADADARASAAALLQATTTAQSLFFCGTSDNTNPTTINDAQPGGFGKATPYPGRKYVSGLSGVITKVNVLINKLHHGYPADIHMVIQSPSGTNVVLMANCGSGLAIYNVNLAFDDAAPVYLTDALITSRSYKPTELGVEVDFPVPGPAPHPFHTTLAAFNGENPNGEWKLWVIDDTPNDVGSFLSWDVQIASH